MCFPWKTIWCIHSSTKVSFFMWCAAKDVILTMDSLIWRRKVIGCLIHCPVAREMWATVFVW